MKTLYCEEGGKHSLVIPVGYFKASYLSVDNWKYSIIVHYNLHNTSQLAGEQTRLVVSCKIQIENVLVNVSPSILRNFVPRAVGSFSQDIGSFRFRLSTEVVTTGKKGKERGKTIMLTLLIPSQKGCNGSLKRLPNIAII